MANWEQAGKGALGGAAVGGAIGGPIGAGIGAVGGGLIGAFGGGGDGEYRPTYSNRYNLPGFKDHYGDYGRAYDRFGSRVAPQAGTFTARESDFRQNQLSLGRQLAREAQGRGVGQQVVRQQANDVANRAMAQQYGMAASARPGMGGAAYTNAAMNAANAQSAVGGQAAMAGAHMQLGAMGQYGQFLQGARGQDLSRYQFNAQQRQQGSQFNADAQLRQMGLNDQAQLEALRQRLAASQMQQQGGLAYQGHLAGYNTAQAGQPGLGDQLMGLGGGALGGYFASRANQPGGSPANPSYVGASGPSPYNYGFEIPGRGY